jgi:hypothetical protein
MRINPFMQQGAFGPEATAAMGKAFDAACKEVHCTSQPEVIRKLITTLILAAATRGELDQVRLRMVAPAGFTIFRLRGVPVSSTANATP